MSVSPSAPEVGVGVDWLTCTAHRPGRVGALLSFGKDLLDQEEGSGAVRQAFHSHGYAGWSAGGVSTAFNGSSTLVRLSGATARECAAGAIAYADNVSRLDVQATVRASTLGSNYAEELFSSLSRTGGSRGRPIARTLIKQSDGGGGIYLGKRISDQYGRIYNKSAEEKEKTSSPRWRYEVEFKRKYALAAAKAYVASEHRDTWITGQVVRWFSDRGVSPPISAVASPTVRGDARGSAAQASRIQWLKVGVRPVVVELAREYGWPDVLRLLGCPVAVSERYINEVVGQEES